LQHPHLSREVPQLSLHHQHLSKKVPLPFLLKTCRAFLKVHPLKELQILLILDYLMETLSPTTMGFPPSLAFPLTPPAWATPLG